jgi:hypothetical protein
MFNPNYIYVFTACAGESNTIRCLYIVRKCRPHVVPSEPPVSRLNRGRLEWVYVRLYLVDNRVTKDQRARAMVKVEVDCDRELLLLESKIYLGSNGFD